MTKRFSLSSFAGGVALGIMLTSAWFLGGNATPELVQPSSTLLATSTPPSLPQSGAVSVNDQPAGTSVVVESVTVPPPGVWVAVREVNDGSLGNVLGAARVSGPRSAVSIPLLRTTEPGRRYAVELYRDDGSGVFDLATLSVYVDFDTGERVVAYFTTTQ